ncbi:MAG: hypothetical protein WCW35_03550 [Bacteroidota bacterium]
MKRSLIVLTSCILFIGQARGQDTTAISAPTTKEDIALATITGIIVPLAIAGVVVSAVPPSYSIVAKEGVAYGAVNLETGFGIGEKKVTGVFSDWRLSFSYSFVLNSKVHNVFRTEVKHDLHFDFVERRKIFLSGVHISSGLLTDFPNEGYTVGAGAWLKTPWLSYFGFFPQHTYGITYRYNKFFRGKVFHEFSLGITAAFTN